MTLLLNKNKEIVNKRIYRLGKLLHLILTIFLPIILSVIFGLVFPVSKDDTDLIQLEFWSMTINLYALSWQMYIIIRNIYTSISYIEKTSEYIRLILEILLSSIPTILIIIYHFTTIPISLSNYSIFYFTCTLITRIIMTISSTSMLFCLYYLIYYGRKYYNDAFDTE